MSILKNEPEAEKLMLTQISMTTHGQLCMITVTGGIVFALKIGDAFFGHSFVRTSDMDEVIDALTIMTKESKDAATEHQS